MSLLRPTMCQQRPLVFVLNVCKRLAASGRAWTRRPYSHRLDRVSLDGQKDVLGYVYRAGQ